MKPQVRSEAMTRAMAGLLAMLLVSATPLQATQEYILPTLFDVIDVAEDDVLNIRAAPSASADIIGSLTPDARDIEVVSHDRTGRWARVNTGERSGWVAARYLAYQVDVWEAGTLPATLHCFGTEPFWSVRHEGGMLVFSTPDAPPLHLERDAVLDTGIFRSPRRAFTASSTSLSLSAVVVPHECSDGMSDRAFGLDASVILDRGDALELLTGCCSIAPR
jgi:uncharacterized membrane protein